MRTHWALGVSLAAAGLGYAVGRDAASAAAGAAAVEVHYAPDENLERIDLALIRGARVSIDMAAYVMTDLPLIEAIADAGARGVKVRIWRDPEMAGRTSFSDVAARIAPDDLNVQMAEKAPGPLIYLKGYCVDGATLRTGSANFFRSGLTQQDNDLVVLRSSEASARFEARFAKAWGRR